MLTPDQIADITRRVHDAEGMDWGATSSREQRNRDWARIAGIVHHGHPLYNPTPDPRWHIKDAGGGRPQSDDVLAFKDTRMIIDFIGGTGANGYTIRAGHWEGPIGPEQNIYAPPVPSGGGVSTPTPPAPSTVWTTKHQALWERLQTRTPLVVAQQLAASFPDEKWGRKRAGAGRDLSDNTIARKMPNGRLWGVKINPYIHLWGELDAAQVFEPVAPVDHLGANQTPPPPPPPIDPPPVDPPIVVAPIDLEPVLAAVKAVGEAVQAQREEVLKAVRGQSYAINATADLGFGGKRQITGIIAPQEKKALPAAPEE